MSCTMITGDAFPSLESRLLEDLRCAVELNALSPKWLLVPNATLANHLGVRLARHAQTTAFANVHVASLPRLAKRLCARLAGASAQPWHALLDLLLCELAEGLPETSPLARLKRISGGPGLLRNAFVDLAEGGFGPEQCEILQEMTADLSERDRESVRLYTGWVALLRDRGIAWSPLALQALPEQIAKASETDLAAALSAEQGQIARLFVYGFYDWIDVNLQWLAALAQRVETTLYYPFHRTGDAAHPAFSFADEVLHDVRTRFGFTGESQAADSASGTINFFLRTFPEGEIGPKPDFLSYQRAAGVRAEAISAAVRIRRWLDDNENPLAPEDILVVAPQADACVDAVQEVFAAFGIPLRVSDVAAGPTPESEALQMLARIWEEQAPAEWVLALLRARPGIAAARGVEVDHFEEKVRELGIWGGTAWRAALERKEFKREDESRRARRVCFDHAERNLIREILKFVPAQGAGPPQRVSVTDALRTLCRLRDRWMSDPTALSPLIAAAEAVARHKPSLQIELRQWTRLLAESDGARTQRDALSKAVLFVPLMRARGLTARGVVVLGLAAGQLPFRIPDNPLLSETAAAKLSRAAAQIGHRLPFNSRVTEEMLLLFLLINTSAERVHWVVPETDATGKAVAPTPWVQRYLQRWEAEAGTAGARDPFAGRIARAPFEQASYLAGLDPKRGSLLPPGLALFIAPKLAADCDLDATQSFLWDSASKRGKEPQWSGCVPPPLRFNDGKIGVTALEALARCPFRFYAESIAGWEGLEALSLSRDLDALTRGTLLHQLLESAVRPHLQQRTVAEIAADMLRDDGAAVRALARRLPELVPDAAFALAMLPPVFREAAMREIVALAVAYFEWAKADPAVPQAAEQRFERQFPGVAGLRVVGKIDRIDRDATTDLMLDFKSGKKKSGYRRLVKLGWQIQAVLYPWLSDKPGATFRYIFLGRGEPKEGDTDGAPNAEEFLGALAPILAEGRFIPTGNQVMEELGLDITPCSYCACVSACRRFEPGSAARHARLFQELAPLRCAAIVAALRS